MVATADSRFYARTSAGKYALDVTEIRSAFLQGEELPARIRRFRDERLSAIAASETPVQLRAGGRVVLHLVPFAALGRGPVIDRSRERCRTGRCPQSTPRAGVDGRCPASSAHRCRGTLGCCGALPRGASRRSGGRASSRRGSDTTTRRALQARAARTYVSPSVARTRAHRSDRRCRRAGRRAPCERPRSMSRAWTRASWPCR